MLVLPDFTASEKKTNLKNGIHLSSFLIRLQMIKIHWVILVSAILEPGFPYFSLPFWDDLRLRLLFSCHWMIQWSWRTMIPVSTLERYFSLPPPPPPPPPPPAPAAAPPPPPQEVTRIALFSLPRLSWQFITGPNDPKRPPTTIFHLAQHWPAFAGQGAQRRHARLPAGRWKRHEWKTFFLVRVYNQQFQAMTTVFVFMVLDFQGYDMNHEILVGE